MNLKLLSLYIDDDEDARWVKDENWIAIILDTCRFLGLVLAPVVSVRLLSFNTHKWCNFDIDFSRCVRSSRFTREHSRTVGYMTEYKCFSSKLNRIEIVANKSNNLWFSLFFFKTLVLASECRCCTRGKRDSFIFQSIHPSINRLRY